MTVQKVFTDVESLGKTARFRLDSISDIDPPLGSVTDGGMEQRRIMWGGDHENIFNSGEYERRNGIVDHGFVIHRHELL